EGQAAGGDVAERREIGSRIEARRLAQAGRQRQRRAGEQQGVAVGRRVGDHVGAERGAGARAVVDDHRLAKAFRKFLRHRAPDAVESAAGRVGNDERDAARRIVLRPRPGRRQQQRRDGGGDGAEADERPSEATVTAGTVHKSYLARVPTDGATAQRLMAAVEDSLPDDAAVAVFAEPDGRWAVELHFVRRPDLPRLRRLVATVAGPRAARALWSA